MDLLAEAIALAKTMADIYLVTLNAMSPEQRAQYAELTLKNALAWQKFLDAIRLPTLSL